MTSIGWSLVEGASQLLERGEREVVLGDLMAAGDGDIDEENRLPCESEGVREYEESAQ